MLLIAGLIGPVSRGPWVGAAAMILVFVATGPAAALGLARLGLLGLAALPFLLGTDAGSVIIDHLPFVGTLESGNVTGRQILAIVSFQVFLENPLLGTYNVLAHPAMEALRGGDGLIDLVNTFVVVGLVRGIVGLSLFAGFFLAVIFGVYRGMRSLADRNDEHHVLGRALMAALVGILVIIATVSPILLVPTIYWLVGGLGVAYAGMLARGRAPAATGRTAPRPVPRAGVRGVFPRVHEER